MRILISSSGKAVGTLYHFTRRIALHKILVSGNLDLSFGRAQRSEDEFSKDKLFFASFARSRTGEYHMDRDMGAIIEVDGDMLSHKYKIVPVDYFNQGKTEKETEERLLSDHESIPFLKYIKRVDFLYARSVYNESKLGEDMLTIIRILKQRKIPYAWYPDAKHWVLRKGAFQVSASQLKPFSDYKKKPSHYVLDSVRLLLSILTRPFSELSAGDRRILGELKTAEDVKFFWLLLSDAKKPNSEQYTRSIAVKVLRVLKRLSIRNEVDLINFISNKKKPKQNTATVPVENTKPPEVEIIAQHLIDVIKNGDSSNYASEFPYISDPFSPSGPAEAELLDKFIVPLRIYGMTDSCYALFKLLEMEFKPEYITAPALVKFMYRKISERI